MRRFLRVIAIVFVSGVVLLSIIYVTQGLDRRARVEKAKEQAAADLTAALPSAQRQATVERDRVRASLTQFGAPANAWQELVCELETNDRGWIVDEYVQQCNIRSVDLFPTVNAAAGNCENLYFPDAATATRSGYVGVWQGQSTVLAVEQPWGHGCPDGLTRPPLLGTSRMLHGQRPTSLSASHGWVVAVTVTPVVRTVLGCHPWKIVWCAEPIDTPVMSTPE